jgi:hypothetical protein
MEGAKQVDADLAGGVRKGRGPLWVLLCAFLAAVAALTGLILGWHDRTAETVGRIVWEETGVRPDVVRRGGRVAVPERVAPSGGTVKRRDGVKVERATIFLTDHRVMVKVLVEGDASRVDALLGAIQERVRTFRVVEVSRE